MCRRNFMNDGRQFPDAARATAESNFRIALASATSAPLTILKSDFAK